MTKQPTRVAVWTWAVAAVALAGCNGALTTWDATSPTGPTGDDPSNPAGPSGDDPSRPTGDDPSGDDPADDGPTSALPSCFDDDFEAGSSTGEGADVGGGCEVTADCREPLICVDGECVAPGEEGAWCDGIDILCPNDGTTCVAGVCVFLDGGCSQNADCPAGYVCEDGSCVPEEGDCIADEDCPGDAICDFGICVDAASCAVTFDLRGEFAVEGVLHLAEASEGVLGAVLSATEWIRDLLNGDDGIPGIGFLVDPIVRSYIESTLYPYQIDTIMALGDVSDLLDDTRIEHTMSLDAPCRELYRGALTFEWVEVEYRGEVIRERPENLPRVGAIPPAEFGARLRCRSMAIDEFRVEQLLGGLIRWATDVVVQHASEGEYDHVEEAIVGVLDCRAIADAVAADLDATWAAAAQAACDEALGDVLDDISRALDETAFDTGLMRLAGEVDVPDEDTLANGHWSGSMLTGDFTGEFSGRRTR